MPKKRKTWLEDILEAFKELGVTRAHRSEIYEKVREIRQREGRPLGHYKEWVQHFLQQNSRGKAKDIFHPVKIGCGIWGLKSEVSNLLAT